MPSSKRRLEKLERQAGPPPKADAVQWIIDQGIPPDRADVIWRSLYTEATDAELDRIIGDGIMDVDGHAVDLNDATDEELDRLIAGVPPAAAIENWNQ